MKVVVYSKPFFPKMGGLERNTRTLCSALTDIGYDARLVTETTSSDDGNYPFQVQRINTVFQLYWRMRGADLVITNGGNLSLRAVVPATLRNLPYGIIYHGFRGFTKRENDAPLVSLKNSLRRQLASRAKFNVFTSTESKQMTDVPEEGTHVVLNPVDKQLQDLYDDSKSKGERGKDAPFLFAGRLIEGKGILLLAEALRRLDQKHQFELIVAGEGRDEDRFWSHVKSLDTIDVEMVGRLSADELIPLYQHSRALLVPTTTHVEGNPLVIAEALYAGTPVIASDQPPMIESVGEAGIIVEQGDPAALASAIARVSSDESYYRSLRRAALDRGDMFSYKRYKDRIRGIMRNVRSNSFV